MTLRIFKLLLPSRSKPARLIHSSKIMTSQGLCAALAGKEGLRSRLTQQYLTRLLAELRKYHCHQELNAEAPSACVNFSVPFEKGTWRKSSLVFNFSVILTCLSTSLVCVVEREQASQVNNLKNN